MTQTFSPQELFGDLLENRGIGAAYEWLALTFVRQFAFRAAGLAMEKSLQEQFSLKRASLLYLFNLLNKRPILWVLLRAQQMGRRIKWWRITQIATRKEKKLVRGL